PGDVILCHPFLFHAASPNHSGRPRFMCNRTTPLKARMAFDRPEGDHSAVEISIRRALGKDRPARSA
ncbi:MAG TPA: phytanoyl-CoA dioxygenase, partial [Limnochordia bacterium]|nr:phytanoyl-CoA dioxygenase [Limnochordia bacterium]